MFANKNVKRCTFLFWHFEQDGQGKNFKMSEMDGEKGERSSLLVNRIVWCLQWKPCELLRWWAFTETQHPKKLYRIGNEPSIDFLWLVKPPMKNRLHQKHDQKQMHPFQQHPVGCLLDSNVALIASLIFYGACEINLINFDEKSATCSHHTKHTYAHSRFLIIKSYTYKYIYKHIIFLIYYI